MKIFNIYLVSKEAEILKQPLLIRRYKELAAAEKDLFLYNFKKENANDINHIAHWEPKNPNPHFFWSEEFSKLIEEKQWRHYDLDYEFIIKEESINIDFYSDSYFILNNQKYWAYYNRIVEEGMFDNEKRLIEGKIFYPNGTISDYGIFGINEENKYKLKTGYMISVCNDEKIYFENFERVLL